MSSTPNQTIKSFPPQEGIHPAVASQLNSLQVNQFKLLERVNSMQIGSSSSVSGVKFISDTRVNMNSYSPASYPINTLFFQTDTYLVYVNSGSAWQYGWGEYTLLQGTPASVIPTVNDVGLIVNLIPAGHRWYWNGRYYQWAGGDPGSSWTTEGVGSVDTRWFAPMSIGGGTINGVWQNNATQTNIPYSAFTVTVGYTRYMRT